MVSVHISVTSLHCINVYGTAISGIWGIHLKRGEQRDGAGRGEVRLV
jgi:hypothetical protein